MPKTFCVRDAVTEIGSCKWGQLTKGLGPCGDACCSGRISMIHAGSAGQDERIWKCTLYRG